MRLLVEDAARIGSRTGLDLKLAAVAVRSQSREREVPVPPGAGMVTTRGDAVGIG